MLLKLTPATVTPTIHFVFGTLPVTRATKSRTKSVPAASQVVLPDQGASHILDLPTRMISTATSTVFTARGIAAIRARTTGTCCARVAREASALDGHQQQMACNSLFRHFQGFTQGRGLRMPAAR
jgi:hypothetical protein